MSAGLTRDEAYRIVQRDARAAWAERRPFRAVLEADADVTLSPAQLDAAFDLTRTLRHVDRFADAVGGAVTMDLLDSLPRSSRARSASSTTPARTACSWWPRTG